MEKVREQCEVTTYLASVRECKSLILAAGYRDIADLYNKMIPIFWGPLKVFISNNIKTSDYAKKVSCPVYVIGSQKDKTLSSKLQIKLAECFKHATVKIFDNIKHEDYFITTEVIEYVSGKIG